MHHARGSARGVLRRASDFASPHFRTPVFPREFVGCSVPVLSASFQFDFRKLNSVHALRNRQSYVPVNWDINWDIRSAFCRTVMRLAHR